MSHLTCIVLLAATTFAGPHSRHAPPPVQQQTQRQDVQRQTVATQTHSSPYSPMIDAREVVPGKCYIGGLPPNAAQGWFEATFTNDTPAPIRFSIDGFPVSVWKAMPMLAQMPDGQTTVVAHQGTDRVVMDSGQESYVLNPGERCHLVFPDTRVDARGHAEWHYTAEQLKPTNANGRYAALGVPGRIHTTEHKVMFSISNKWIQFRTGDKYLDWHWSRDFGEE